MAILSQTEFLFRVCVYRSDAGSVGTVRHARGSTCLGGTKLAGLSRRQIICAAHSNRANNDRSVFGLHEGRSSSLQEAKEAHDTCSLLHGKQREDCYANFGCDADRVERYLGPVISLESKLPESSDPKSEWVTCVASLLPTQAAITLLSSKDNLSALGLSRLRLPAGLAVKMACQAIVAVGLACLVVMEIFLNVASSLAMGSRAVGEMLQRLLQPRNSETLDSDAEKFYTFDAERLTFKEYHGMDGNSQSAAQQGK